MEYHLEVEVAAGLGWDMTVGFGPSTLRLMEKSWGAALEMQGTAVSLLKQLGCRSFSRDDAYNHAQIVQANAAPELREAPK